MVSSGLCLAVTAVAFAAVAGFAASQRFFEAGVRTYRHSLAMEASGADGFRLFVQNGCKPLLPLSGLLLRSHQLEGACAELVVLAKEKTGLSFNGSSLMSWLLAVTAFTFVAAGVFSSSFVGGLACATCLVVGCFGAARTAVEGRAEEVREAVPSALRSMGVCFKAGLSLQQTLKQVSREVQGPLSEAFVSAAYVLETGGSVPEALEMLKERSLSSELAFVCVALKVQHSTGGSLSPVLEAARESVQDDIELKRSLRVQTSQARLSARIVTVMPFLLIALFSLMSEGFLDPFFNSVAGFVLLALALLMQFAGVFLVRRMLDVKVG